MTNCSVTMRIADGDTIVIGVKKIDGEIVYEDGGSGQVEKMLTHMASLVCSVFRNGDGQDTIVHVSILAV